MTQAVERAPAPAAEAERRRWRFPAAPVVTLISAVIAATISGTTLVYTLWPGLRPDPKEKVGADITSLAVDENVTRGDYLCRIGQRPAGTPGLGQTGNVYYVRAEIEGFKRSSVDLKWFTYDTHHRRLPGLRSSTAEVSVFRPQAPINTQIAEVWVRTPNKNGTFFVRFELYAKDVLLAFVDSRKFEARFDPFPPRDGSAACS